MNTKYLLFPFFSAVGVAAALSFISCASGNSVPPAVEASRSEFAPIAADVTPDAVFEIRIVDADHQVRVVNKPTLAALDFAAYSSNPIRLAGKDEVPENYKGTMGNAQIADYPFPMLDTVVGYMPRAVAGVTPVAWEPFSKILYAQTGADSLAIVLNSVEAVKWGEPEVFRAFQNVTRLWGVKKDNVVEWWVEILPASWTKRQVFYGKLKLTSGGETAEILNYYLTAEMNAEDAMNWARTLSSYWYPTLNTDLEQHVPGDNWLNEKNRPFAVMRGNPMGKPMWIAFEVPAFRMTDEDIYAQRKADSLLAAGEVVPVDRTLDGLAIGATSSSAMAVPWDPSNSVGGDTTALAGNPPAQEIPYVETINVGSQVWMKSLGAGGIALDWNSAMAPGGCPEGFRLPTLGEADLLLHMNVDGSLADGIEEGVITGGSTRVRALGWLPANNTGNGVVDGKFWTSEEYGETGAYYFAVSATEDDALLQGDLRTNVAYVRCIKK